ncbi:MAG TPA: glycosyltransferase family 39 protein [Blastocatellia bacterium]
MSSNNSPRPSPLPSAEVGLTAAESTPFASWLRPGRWSLPQYNDWSDDSGSAQVAFLIVLLSVAVYIPFLAIPLLPDDYLQAALARQYGPVSAWGALAKDPLYRSRATSLVLTHWTETVFGFSRLAFGISSILLHAVNALLVYALGAARRIGWRLSALMAIFFALQERYHEAVIWYAALPELLAFCFGLLTLLFWVRWLQYPKRAILAWVGALACFCLALLSKESAVCVILLMILFVVSESGRRLRPLLALLPFVLLAAIDVALVFSGQDQNHHFRDGTFSLQAGALKALIGSAVRALWIWGIVGLIVLMFFPPRKRYGVMALALGWALIALIPYSFLTYMPRVPSRHHYLAAVGCSLILALAATTLQERIGKRWVIALCALLIGVHHVSYLWAVKYSQFRGRAEPIEALLRHMRSQQKRPVVIRCFPYSFGEARRAVMIRLGEPEANLILDTESGNANLPSFCPPGTRISPP